MIIACKAQERVHHAHGARRQPVQDCLYFLLVHGYFGDRDNVAEVGHFATPKSTLGVLHEQLVLL
jgi:hypothetical protein